jgi:predicted negative regulator of RcsB-dependent stress response
MLVYVPTQGPERGPGGRVAAGPGSIDPRTEPDRLPDDELFDDDDDDEPRTCRGEVGPKGSLAKIAVAKVFFEMYAAGVTGALLFSKDDTKKIVYLRSGYPISVKSNVVAECLGKILLWDGTISEEQWRQSLQIMRETNQRQGAVLITLGAITPQELARGLSLQSRFRICELFSWREGQYRLWPGVAPPAEMTGIDATPAALIHEGVRAFMPHRRVIQELRPYTHAYLRPNPNAFFRFQDLRATEELDALLDLVDGTATVEEVLRSSALPVPQTSALLYTVLCTEMAVPSKTAARSRGSLKVVATGQAKPPGAGAAPPRVALARLVEQLRAQTPHEILGVPIDAPAPTLRIAFQQRASERHPDRLDSGRGEGLRALAAEALSLTADAYATLTPPDPTDDDDTTSPGELATIELASRPLSALNTAAGAAGEGEINSLVQRIISAERHHQQGLELLDQGRFAESATALSRAVSACEEEGDFRASLAWAVFQSGLDDSAAHQALSHLDEALVKSPSARGYLFRGHILRFLGRADEAIWAFQEALRRDPSNVEAQSELDRIREDHRVKSS